MMWPTAESTQAFVDTGSIKQYVRTCFVLSLLAYISYTMYSSAMLVYVPFPELKDLPVQPLFGETFRSKVWLLFTPDRLVKAPISYGWLHVVVSLLWLVTFPLQYIGYVRKEYPALHRTAGYVNLSLVTTLAISGLSFLPRSLSYSADSIWHVHTLRIHIRHALHIALRDRSSGMDTPLLPQPQGKGTLLLAWPTFDLSVVWLGFGTILCVWQTVRHARACRYRQHKLWALALGIWCYSIPLHRLIVLWTNRTGQWIGTSWPKDLQDAVGIPTELEDIVEGEKALFAWTQAASNIPIAIAMWNIRKISKLLD